MKPVQFTTYILKETTEEYTYLGNGELLYDDGRENGTVCIMSPVISGYAPPPKPGFTRFIICDEDAFAELFDESSPLGDPVERS